MDSQSVLSAVSEPAAKFNDIRTHDNKDWLSRLQPCTNRIKIFQ